MNKEIQSGEVLETRYQLGLIDVALTDKRVIVENEGEIESMKLKDITEVVLVKGDEYEHKEDLWHKILQKVGLAEKPTYPIKVEFKAALPTARRMSFMTTTEYEEAVDDFHTKINLKAMNEE